MRLTSGSASQGCATFKPSLGTSPAHLPGRTPIRRLPLTPGHPPDWLMAPVRVPETALYRAVKCFLEAQGFVVKGEVGHCDIVAVRGDEPPLVVIAELKLGLSLELVLQGIDRMRGGRCDLARGARGRGAAATADRRAQPALPHARFSAFSRSPRAPTLSRCSPSRPPYRPPRRSRAPAVFCCASTRGRRGDPTSGGQSRAPVMTAYRQQALGLRGRRCRRGPQRVRSLTPVRAGGRQHPAAQRPMAGFTRLSRGVYGLTEAGRAALLLWPTAGGPGAGGPGGGGPGGGGLVIPARNRPTFDAAIARIAAPPSPSARPPR